MCILSVENVVHVQLLPQTAQLKVILLSVYAILCLTSSSKQGQHRALYLNSPVKQGQEGAKGEQGQTGANGRTVSTRFRY